MRKLMIMLVVIISCVILSSLRNGNAAEFGTLEERMNYLETRVSELSATSDDFKGTLKEHGSLLGAIKGIQDRVSVGFGLRTQFSTTEDAAGFKDDGVAFFVLNNSVFGLADVITKEVINPNDVIVFEACEGRIFQMSDGPVQNIQSGVPNARFRHLP